MDKSKALKYLKEAIDKIPYLKTLSWDNQEYKLWRDGILDVLEASFGRKSNEYEKFSRAWPHVITYDHQNDYLKELPMRETALLSIIQKYEILGVGEKSTAIEVAPESILREVPVQAFISHGKNTVALSKLTEFLETLGIEPLIVKKRASLDKDLPDKVNLYLNQADFVIILATADDKVGDKLQPRQNVIHEIGLAQKTNPGRIIYLLEEGAEFPSNIRPRVWENFKQRNMMNAFLGIIRELRAYGMLKIVKVPPEEQTLAR